MRAAGHRLAIALKAYLELGIGPGDDEDERFRKRGGTAVLTFIALLTLPDMVEFLSLNRPLTAAVELAFLVIAAVYAVVAVTLVLVLRLMARRFDAADDAVEVGGGVVPYHTSESAFSSVLHVMSASRPVTLIAWTFEITGPAQSIAAVSVLGMFWPP